MSLHWTYLKHDPDDDLYQGDLIERTDRLIGVLDEVHRHFCDVKYLAFLILTQTCDLVVRKKGKCKAKHVSLAVIRSLEDVVPSLFAESSGTGIGGIYREEKIDESRELLERILNQNEQAHGLFYLHPHADVKIAVPAVALLRVSISLRSHEHYELLKASRCGRLNPEYRNKLGWLAGNLYSRVDTPDWADQDGGEVQAGEIIKGYLHGTQLREPNAWVPESWINSAKKDKVDLNGLDREQALEKLRAYAPPPSIEVVTTRIRELGEKMQVELGNDLLADLVSRLVGDASFAILAAEHVANISGHPSLFQRFRDDQPFRDALAAPIKKAADRFRTFRGARSIDNFLALYAEGRFLEPEGIALAGELVKGTLDAAEIDAFDAALQASTSPPQLAAYIRSIATEMISAGLMERMTKRLENDGKLKTALK